MRSKKHQFLLNLIRVPLFIVLFVLMDYPYISEGNKPPDYGNLGTIMNTGVGYNNLFLIGGLLLTAVYILGLTFCFHNDDALYVVKMGKKVFYRRTVWRVLEDAFLISLEYVGSAAIICSLFFPFSLLIESRFYLCCLLYAFMLFLYFSILGVSTVVIRIIVNFKKSYLLFSLVLFFFMAGLYVFHIEISPIYFCSFISEWFQSGAFDILYYGVAAIKCVLSFFAVYVLGSILMMNKDIVLHE